MLLDTHVLLWCLTDSPRLKNKIAVQIQSARQLFASALGMQEIYDKYASGKLEIPANLEEELDHRRIIILPFTRSHALAAKNLPFHHRDPFDRMMIGQAKAERLPFVTADENIWRYDIKLVKA